MVGNEQELRLQKIIQSITRAARADGKITQEEQELLESIQINVLIYDQAIDDALADGIIDDEEKDTLQAIKQSILSEAYEIAEVSEGVSDDEVKMLQILLQELENTE